MYLYYFKAMNFRDGLVERAQRFLRNERGESSVLANIMMLAIAAMVVAGLFLFGQTIWTYLKSFWTQTTDKAPAGQTPFGG